MLRLVRLSSTRATLRSPFLRFSSSSPPSPSSPPTLLARAQRRFQPYLAPLLHRYPLLSPSSLTLSFLVLHELTAVVPLVPLYYLFTAIGFGATVSAYASGEDAGEGKGMRERVRGWLEEAEDKAGRVGRRYGWFGMDKESKEEREERRRRQEDREETGGGEEEKELERKARERTLGEPFLNAAAAYLAVKALLPLRIALSVGLAPRLANSGAFSLRRWRSAFGKRGMA
ncbi:hypothetical protein JCM8547_002011 [Rhodosporidiobolus lusitaniae]